MALSTRTYSDLEFLVSARSGHELNANTKERVRALLNSAAQIAYRASPYWSRQLVLEPRKVERGYVQCEEDGFNVYGAGSQPVNGLYSRNGTANGKVYYNKFQGDIPMFDLGWSSDNSRWEITARTYITSKGVIVTSDGAWVYQAGDVLYYNEDTGATPIEGGWVSSVGEDLAPIVQALSVIDEVHGYWNGAKWEGSSPSSGDFYVDGNGVRLTNTDTDVVYVAYKKAHTDIYGDGTSGTVASIPSEWFEFMAYHAAMSYQVAEQVGVERMTIAFRDVQGRLDDELLKISRQGIWRTIAQKMKTYYSSDVSVN